ncbi:hypothetical protein NLI96_g2625 [Meripilus lineatus]|uniref:Uncharacterized protein n=1 Tax=Meripilus lineatus TaxID=2056292 RepID=A0AAD5VDT2_9APHY|nr:hypothetical protein NLI96_g2625 [Physisporinus lineatus]
MKNDWVLRYPHPSVIRGRRLYYNFLQQHPSHIPIQIHAFREVIDALNSYRLDYYLNGLDSVSPFSKVECEDLIKVLEGMLAQPCRESPATTALVSWVLKDIYGFRQRDRFGRLTRKQLTDARASSILPPRATHLSPMPRKMLSFIIAFPFFGIPRTYLAHTKVATEPHGRLSDMEQSWEVYTEQLTREYSEFVLASTVLLSATVGFLALPDIEIIAKALGIVSVFSSLSSIIIGVFFTWRHHRRLPSSNTMAYIHNARNNPLGLEGHAVLLSLPPTFLVWSIITFTAGVVAYTLQHATIKSPAAWAIMGCFIVFISLLFVGLSTFSKIWVWKRKKSWV